MHTYEVQGEVLDLEHHPDVFPPSAFGLQFARQVDFRGCRRAADIGTGTGLLAILAAKKGVPEVQATDVSLEAVRLAQGNAHRLEAAAVTVTQGNFFGSLTGRFDVITANLPQEIVPPPYGRELSRPQLRAIHGGGAGGNAVLLDFLDEAPAFMHERGRLYVIVNTITDYRRTLSHIEERFRATLIWEGLTAAKSFVGENIAFFQPLLEAGTIALVQDGHGVWKARQFIYRLTLGGR